jgi:hypothetical protein
MGYIQFSPTIGQTPKLWKFIPYSMLVTFVGWGLIVGFTYGVFSQSFGVPISEVYPISIYIAGLLLDLLLRGNVPYKFESKFFKGTPRYRAGTRINVPTMTTLSPPKVPSAKIDGKKHSAIENFGDLVAVIEFKLGKHDVGAFLLQQTEKYQIVFSWDLQTYTSSITPKQGLTIAKRFRYGLRSTPLGESITFYSGAWRNDEQAIADLRRPERNRNKLSQLLTEFLVDRLKTQTALGRRLRKSFYVNATYTISSARGDKAVDSLEELLDMFGSAWTEVSKMMGFHKPSFKNLPRFLTEGYERGFTSYNRFFIKQLGLAGEPLTAEQFWEREYHRFNDGGVPPLPFKIVVEKKGFKTAARIVKNPAYPGKKIPSLRGLMFWKGAPNTEPKNHVYLPGRDMYVGGAVWDIDPLVKYADEKEDIALQMEDALAQLFYGSSVINDCPEPGQGSSESEVYDTEIVVQISGVNQSAIRKRAAKLEDESNYSRKQAAKLGDISAAANFKQEKTTGDRWALMEGSEVCKIGWVAMVYRKRATDLARAVNAISDLPTTKTFVAPEREYFPVIWKHTLPIHLGQLGKGPVLWWNRQMEDFTEAATTFLPVMGDWTRAKTGLEYQAEYGNSPFFVNICDRGKTSRTVTLGESGSGKSVKACGEIIMEYQSDTPSFVIDATQGQIATFAPICDALGGAFFNSETDCFNFMQAVDLRKIESDPILYNYSTNLLREQWTATIPLLALNGRSDANLLASYKEIVSMLANAWFVDPEIRRRYDMAYDVGYSDTDDWKGMPTLRTFLEFAHISRLPEESQDEYKASMDRFVAHLGAFLSSPTGQRVSSPTSFDIVDKPLVVCALGNINTKAETDVLPLISAVLGMTTSAALSFDAVSVRLDEASKLFDYEVVPRTFGGYFSGGRKQGLNAHVIGQDLQSLERSPHFSKISDNTTSWSIGRVTPQASHYLSQRDKLNIPIELMNLVDQSSPEPSRYEAYSRWVVKTENRVLLGRYSPSFLHLAIAMNSKVENKWRDEIMASYPGNRLAGYAACARILKERSLDGKIKEV